MNSADIFGCGHASALMDVNTVKGYPQIHLHFLTDKTEYDELGYGRVELCCHGCGCSLLMYYTESHSQHRAHVKVRDIFVESHRGCRRKTFGRHCPNWRSRFDFVDIRSAQNPSDSRDKRIQRSS
jgi:hypothetical protein